MPPLRKAARSPLRLVPTLTVAVIAAASAVVLLPGQALAAGCPAAPALVNGGFEIPATGVANDDLPAANAATPTPGIGWSTDDPAQVLEIWQDGFLGVPADSGNQFVEINANAQDTLTQDIATVPGTEIRWQLAHRGRAGNDTLQLRIGPVGGPLVAQVPDGQAGADIVDGVAAWGHYTGVYQVPAGQTTTRFAFVAVDEAFNPSFGNFLDSVSLRMLPTAHADSATTTAGHAVLVHVAANDCGSGLTVQSTTAPSHGSLVVSGASVRYAPSGLFVGLDHFTYTVVDPDGDTATATVTVQVTKPVPPVAEPLHSTGGPGEQQRVHPAVHSGSTLRLLDAQGHPTTQVTVSGQGVYTVSGTTLTFIPDDGFLGTAEPVLYQIQDAFGQSAMSTYTATVVAELADTGGGAVPRSVAVGLALLTTGSALTLLARRTRHD